ncbi:methyltransferase-like protein 27 isoform X3 [Sebastes fasciatus]|uniref:methyltransferase-like protein 27 isoform X3 n=1 Tax=Sebastes fasciatus TaxID=394691 RepID=UPI003D9ED6E8
MSDSFRTVDDVKTLLESWKGFDSRQRMKFYDSWAETYDQDTEMINYRAPHLMVDFLNANFSGNREEVQVLDVACGSGLVAKLMIELGFKHFAGVDGSKGMLEQAAKTGLYQDLKLALLGTEPLPAQTAGPAIRNGPPAVWCRLPAGTGGAARRSSSTGRRRSRSCQAQSSLPPAGALTAGRIGSEAGSASVRGGLVAGGGPTVI